MKHLLYICILISFTSCSIENEQQISQSDTKQLVLEDSLAIMGNFKRQEECWNKHDLDCYVEAYDTTNEVQTVSRLGVTKGYQNILAEYKTYFPEDRMGTLLFDKINLKRLSDQYYYVVGRFNLKYEEPDTTLHGWFSVLMEKKNGSWLMISDHSS